VGEGRGEGVFGGRFPHRSRTRKPASPGGRGKKSTGGIKPSLPFLTAEDAECAEINSIQMKLSSIFLSDPQRSQRLIDISLTAAGQESPPLPVGEGKDQQVG